MGRPLYGNGAGDRGVGELLVEYLARREVTPVQLEDILVELLP